MNDFRKISSLSSTRQLKRVGAPTGGLGTAHWWMLGTGAPLAACASDDDSSPAPGTNSPSTPPTTIDPVFGIIPFENATVAGNDTTIDLDGAFESGYTIIGASDGIIGSDKLLTLSDAEFPEGTNNITVTATDADGSTVTQTIELVSDKTPTIATALTDMTVAGNVGTIDLDGVFGNGSGELTLTTTLGTIDDDKLTLTDAVFTEGTHTITITATDSDGDAVEDIVVLVSDKTPTIANTVADKSITGNSGTIIDISNVFGGGSGDLTLTASDGTLDTNSSMLTLMGDGLVDGINTITVTATDADGDTVTMDITINANKSPTLVTAAADVTVAGNGGTIIDLNGVFGNAGGALTLSASAGTVGSNNSLTLAGYELGDGMNTLTVTATDADSETVTDEFVITTTKSLAILTDAAATLYGATQHDTQTFNLARVFGIPTGTNLAFTTTTSTGISLNGSTLTFDNKTDTGLTEGEHTITITATKGSDTLTHILTYSLDTIKGKSGFGFTTYNGTTGNDEITGNSFTPKNNHLFSVDLDGGAGNDTISNNTFTANSEVSDITFDGGDGNDTISNNHFKVTGSFANDNVYAVTLMGGAGDDEFRDNFTSQANGRLAALNIDGGDGEDTVVFRSISDEYTGITDWLVLSDGGVTTITLNGDGAAVTLINVETIAFADGASYGAADAGVADNGGVLYDLTNKFAGTFTAYSTDSGNIGSDNTLTLTGSELASGSNSIVVTATANDSGGTETTETITVNAIKTLKIAGAKQHAQQTIDLDVIFVDANTYTYTSTETLPSGISRSSSTLDFDNTALSEGTHMITITATDGSEAFTHTLTYALDTITGQSDGGSNTAYTGSTLADAITGNSFTASGLTNIDLDGGAGDDTISSNTLTTSNVAYNITIDGGAGDDTISSNSLTATFDVRSITFDGGAGDDTISSNTLTTSNLANNITFDGGAGDDTISDNHLESTVANPVYDVDDVTFMGGVGDDVFSGNTATQANSELASITIDGGSGTDAVHFKLASDMFTITGAYGSNITVTDIAKRTGDVKSFAEYVLIDIEELYFAESDMAFVFP